MNSQVDWGDNPRAWMIAQAKEYGLKYLLAHADDGVIWGEFRNSDLRLSNEVFRQFFKELELNPQTLQQARLFGESAELLVWKSADGWQSQLLKDDAAAEYFDDEHWLWGTRGKLGVEKDGFTLLVEGEQGLRHAPPIDRLGENDRVALVVRHFVEYDNEGQAFIAFSRLVNVKKVKEA